MTKPLDTLQAKFPVHYRSGRTLLLNADCMDVMAEIGDGTVRMDRVRS